jgi:hypothetical protein
LVYHFFKPYLTNPLTSKKRKFIGHFCHGNFNATVIYLWTGCFGHGVGVGVGVGLGVGVGHVVGLGVGVGDWNENIFRKRRKTLTTLEKDEKSI